MLRVPIYRRSRVKRLKRKAEWDINATVRVGKEYRRISGGLELPKGTKVGTRDRKDRDSVVGAMERATKLFTEPVKRGRNKGKYRVPAGLFYGHTYTSIAELTKRPFEYVDSVEDYDITNVRRDEYVGKSRKGAERGGREPRPLFKQEQYARDRGRDPKMHERKFIREHGRSSTPQDRAKPSYWTV